MRDTAPIAGSSWSNDVLRHGALLATAFSVTASVALALLGAQLGWVYVAALIAGAALLVMTSFRPLTGLIAFLLLSASPLVGRTNGLEPSEAAVAALYAWTVLTALAARLRRRAAPVPAGDHLGTVCRPLLFLAFQIPLNYAVATSNHIPMLAFLRQLYPLSLVFSGCIVLWDARTERDLRYVLVSVMALAVVAYPFEVYAATARRQTLAQYLYGRVYTLEEFATLPKSPVLTMGLALVTALGLRFAAHTRLARAVSSTAALAALLASVVYWSRTLLAASAASVLSVAILAGTGRVRFGTRLVAAVATLVGAYMLIMASGTAAPRLLELTASRYGVLKLLSLSDTSLSDRLLILRLATDEVVRSRLLGFGFGYGMTYRASGGAYVTHLGVLAALLEGGVPLLAGLTWYMCAALKTALRVWRRSDIPPLYRGIAWATAAGVIYVGFSGLSNPILESPPLMLFLGILPLVTARIADWRTPRERRGSGLPPETAMRGAGARPSVAPQPGA